MYVKHLLNAKSIMYHINVRQYGISTQTNNMYLYVACDKIPCNHTLKVCKLALLLQTASW
jgi:hypothetical protein